MLTKRPHHPPPGPKGYKAHASPPVGSHQAVNPICVSCSCASCSCASTPFGSHGASQLPLRAAEAMRDTAAGLGTRSAPRAGGRPLRPSVTTGRRVTRVWRQLLVCLALCLPTGVWPTGVPPLGIGRSGIGQLGGHLSFSQRAWAEPGAGGKPTNRLARETSPYLLAHAHNPVDWYPWGPEALQKARDENKLIFLSIGYSSCHWCHVMEKKVFSNPEIAAAMNENFVNIKVDREERPDLDDLYMTALQVYFEATGSKQGGGWPLSMFLTPDGRPLGGATYLPPVAEPGGLSFPDLMKNVVASWSDPELRKRQLQNAEILSRAVRSAYRSLPAAQPVAADQALLDRVFQALEVTFDAEYGGLGYNPRNPTRPKFPVPPKLALLQALSTGGPQAPAAERMLRTTLDRMSAGGIYDHVGGGFHRYSTDRYWRIPHFEKMLYDNAQLASVYTAAWKQSRQPRDREVAIATLDFVLRELTAPEGGFYTALDADSEGVEGKYYCWTTEELEAVLQGEDLAICHAVYGTGGRPNFEEGHVLQYRGDLEEAATELQLGAAELRTRLKKINQALLATREQRVRPLLDDKILCGWNGLMIAALAEAGAAFDRPDYLDAARKAAEFLARGLRQKNGRMFRSHCQGEPRIEAYAEDYALLAHGLLVLAEATGDERYNNAARNLTTLQLDLFWDAEGAGCFTTSRFHEELLARTKAPFDSVLPSANSATARNLLRIAQLKPDPTLTEKARATIASFAPQIENSPTSFAYLALALHESLQGGPAADDAPAGSPDTPPAEKSRAPRGGEPTPQASAGQPGDPVQAELFLDSLPVAPGQSCRVLVRLTVAEGWHIQGNPPGDPDNDEPTEIELTPQPGFDLANLRFPPGEVVDRGPEELPAKYLTGVVEVPGTLAIPSSAAGEELPLEVLVRCQACVEGKCLPKKLRLKLRLPVAASAAEARPANTALFPGNRPAPRPPAGSATPPKVPSPAGSPAGGPRPSSRVRRG